MRKLPDLTKRDHRSVGNRAAKRHSLAGGESAKADWSHPSLRLIFVKSITQKHLLKVCDVARTVFVLRDGQVLGRVRGMSLTTCPFLELQKRVESQIPVSNKTLNLTSVNNLVSAFPKSDTRTNDNRDQIT